MERIRVFVRVAELNSFAAAARDLRVSRSIATRYVGELEAELGVQLLVRTTRKVSLTAAGRLFLERVRPAVAALDRAREIVRQQHETLSGEMRISAPVSFGQRFLPAMLSAFRTTHPDLRLEVDLTDRFVDVIEEGCDMALRISGPPSGVSHIWRKICAIPRVMVAAPGYIAQHGAPDHPAALRAHDVLGYSHFAGGPVWQFTQDGTGERVSVTPAPGFETNSGELIAGMACRGGGIALLPVFMVAEALEAGRLVRLCPHWSAPDIWLTAFYPPYDRMPAKVAALTGFVEDMARENPALR